MTVKVDSWERDHNDATSAQSDGATAIEAIDRELANLKGHLEARDERIEELESEVETLREQLEEATR